MSKTTQKIRIYSALEVANICGVVNQTAINWIRNGYLKAFSTPGGQYRVYEDDLSNFLSGHGMRNSAAALHLVDKNSGAKNETALIIDHRYDAGSRLKEWLENTFSNYEVVQARDGFEAGWLFCRFKPGLIFLNADLPGVNVHDMARKFKEDPASGNPYVIALTPDNSGGTVPWADACFPRRLDGDHARNIILSLGQMPVTA
ncbi:MAG: helix-turn-helix domain-containing protein [Treponema sp.]|nr:helix-turn-helix domain-containing protein [Treponema sp.]